MAAERTDGLIKTFIAGAAIADGRIVRFGTNDDTVLLSTAANQAHIGVSIVPRGQEYPARYGEAIPNEFSAAIGNQVDVALSGIANVKYGGTVARGALLTSDSQGRAIEATLPLTDSQRVIGMATVSGVVNDLGCVYLFPQQVSGFAGQGSVPSSAVFTIGTEATNAIAVQIQAKDVAGNNPTQGVVIDVYLASTANGLTMATAPNGGVAVSQGAAIASLATNLAWKLVTNATGRVDLTLTESTAKSFYVVAVINGRIIVSDAVTFA